MVGWGDDALSQSTTPAGLSGEVVSAVSAGLNHSLAITTTLRADREPIVSGVPRVSEALTAVPGPYNVPPTGGLDYQWHAGGDPVGTNTSVYRPTAADIGKTITVTVTAHRTGSTDAVGTSDPTGPVLAGGLITGWGANYAGQTDVPALPEGLSYTALAAGNGYSLALRSDGTVAAWGTDGDGQTDVPALPGGLSYTAIAAGSLHAVALRSDGTVVAWGYNADGETDVPALPGGVTYTAIAADGHSLALRSDGTIAAWGYNLFGQTDVPALDPGLTYTAISAGGSHSLALLSDGAVAAWGADGFDETLVPASLLGATVTAIAGGSSHSLALTADLVGDAPPAISGVAQVGRTLTVTTPTYNAVPDDITYQWAVDRIPIGSATGTTYTLTPADLGKLITVRVRATKAGYRTASEFAGEVGPVAAVAFHSATRPTITGTAQVGQRLTANPGVYSPTPTRYGYRWYADDQPIAAANGPTYDLTPAELGKRITVAVTGFRSGYTAITGVSLASGPVVAADWSTLPTALISGDPKVGEPLTADAGTPSPTPDSVTFEWYADGEPVGAGGETYVPGRSDVGKQITVRVTVVRAGYEPAAATSDPVGPVVTDRAPKVKLTVSRTKVRLGDRIKLTWTSTDAARLVARGAWHGARPADGQLRIRPARLGRIVYKLKAVNANGVTVKKVVIRVKRPR